MVRRRSGVSHGIQIPYQLIISLLFKVQILSMLKLIASHLQQMVLALSQVHFLQFQFFASHLKLGVREIAHLIPNDVVIHLEFLQLVRLY